jgi:hypothetical protein
VDLSIRRPPRYRLSYEKLKLEQQKQDGAEIPPPLQQNIILLSKNEIKYLSAHLKCGVVKKIVLWNSNFLNWLVPLFLKSKLVQFVVCQ